MARYVLLFAGVHFPIAIALGFLLQALGHETGGGIGLVVILAAASVVGWRFVKTRRRLFTPNEKWELIGGCLAYVLLFEAFGFWGLADTLPTLTAKWWVGVAGFTIALDFFAIWMSYQHPVRRMMQRQLDQLSK